MLILLILLIEALLFAVFIVIRNEWVFKQRQALWNNAQEYNKLPSYHTMVWTFWIWDVNKYKSRSTPKLKSKIGF